VRADAGADAIASEAAPIRVTICNLFLIGANSFKPRTINAHINAVSR